MRIIRSVLIFSLFFSMLAAPRSEAMTDPKDAKLIIGFMGTGTLLSWSLGVVKALYEKVSAVREGKVILSSNSGTSYLAAYLHYHGINEESLKGAERLLKDFPRKRFDENANSKMSRFLGGTPLTDLELDLEAELAGVMKQVTETGSKKQPELPLIITSTTENLIDTGASRNAVSYALTLLPSRFVFYPNYFVYQMTGSGFKNLGKTCVYNVTENLIPYLEKMPYEQLQCLYKSMQVPDDLMDVRPGPNQGRPLDPTYFVQTALLGTSAEPGVGHRILERYPNTIKGIDLRRYPEHEIKGTLWYRGSLSHPSTAIQDFRRVLPHLYAIGTGRSLWNEPLDRMLRKSYLLSARRGSFLGNWWFDTQIPLSQTAAKSYIRKSDKEDPKAYREEMDRIFDEGMNAGYAATLECLKTHACYPAVTEEPYFSYPLTEKTESDKVAPGFKERQPKMPTQRSLAPLTVSN